MLDGPQKNGPVLSLALPTKWKRFVFQFFPTKRKKCFPDFYFDLKNKRTLFSLRKKVIGLLRDPTGLSVKKKRKIRYTIADLVSRTQEKERRSLEIIQLRIKRGTKNKHVVVGCCCRHGFTSVVSGSHDWPSSASGQLHRDCLPVHKSLVLYYWWKNRRRRSKRQNGSSQAWQKCHIQSAAGPFRANGSTTARQTQST
jgi:hypothetical protein